jgi:integrase
MPQKRNKENKGLPSRWRHLRGAYYYAVPKGREDMWDGKQLFKLGDDLPSAYKEWALRLETLGTVKTISQLLDRYALEVIPTKAIRTQAENRRELAKLKGVFGHLPLNAIKPIDIYKYVDKRSAKVSARREVALFKHAYTKAVQWGFLDKHPFKGEVRLEGEAPRSRYVEDWEIIECLALTAMRKAGSVRAIQAYIRLKLLTGLRRGDLLRLRVSDIREGGIHVTTSKTGKRLIFESSGALQSAIADALKARPVDISPFLFCNLMGQCYFDEAGDASGWNSMWQRFMDRLLKETKIKERFTEHDLRAKVGSDAESLERARQLLGHADSKITSRVYRRKPEVVRPTE